MGVCHAKSNVKNDDYSSFAKSNIYEIAVKQHGCSLRDVPLEFKTEKLCQIALNHRYGTTALEYVPEELKTAKLCQLAINNNGMALKYVPDELKTTKLCKKAVKDCGLAIQYIPDNIIVKIK